MHYVRLSIQEELQKQPNAGLRYIINKAIAKLKQGENVVIDDENDSRTKRGSFIKVLKDKVPHCSIRCISLKPKWGRDQLLWSLAYLRADWIERNWYQGSPSQCPYEESQLDRWIADQGGGADSPSKTEGFNKVDEISLDFHVFTYHKFEVPSLFIQYESIMDSKTDTVVKGVGPALQNWCSANPCGCVVFIMGHISGVDPEDKFHQMRVHLQSVTDQLPDVPLFVLSVDSILQMSSFFVFPQPGLIAMCQRLFHLDFTHKASMFLYHNQDGLKAAENTGIKYMKAMRVFQHPKMITSYNMMTSPAIPKLLKHMKLSWPSLRVEVPEAGVPLLDLEGETCDGMHYSKFVIDARLSLHVCAKSKECCGSFNQVYKDHATPITEDGSRLRALYQEEKPAVLEDFPPTLDSRHSSSSSTTSSVREQDLPKWMVKKKAHQVALTTMLDTPKKERKSPMKTKSQIYTTVYVMSEAELLDMANNILQKKEANDSENHSVETGADSETTDNADQARKSSPTRQVNLSTLEKSRIEQDLEMESLKFTKEECAKSNIKTSASRSKEKKQTPTKADVTESCLDDIFSSDERSTCRKKRPPKTRSVKRSAMDSDDDDVPAIKLPTKTSSAKQTKKSTDTDFSFLDDLDF